MESKNKALIRSLYQDHINRHDLNSLANIISGDFVDQVTGEKGLSAYQKGIQNLLVGFPDVHFEVEELIEESNKVVVRWKWTGTHLGSFAKSEPTGRKVENIGVVIFTIQDGKVISTWALVDRLGVLQQISK